MSQGAAAGRSRGQMTFWGHLEILRGVLLRMGLVVVLAAVALFAVMPWIFDHVVLAPTRAGFWLYGLTDWIPDMDTPDGRPFHVDLINTGLASQLMIQVSASCWGAVVLTFPLLVRMLWGFVAPGLYARERRGAQTAWALGCGMFFAGVAVGYGVVFPVALRFLADYQLSAVIPNTITIDSYMDNFFGMVLAMGAVFELPVAAWMLGRAGLLDRGFFARHRRQAVAVLLVAAAAITPTGDPFTLAVAFVPLYALWEVAALLVPKPAVHYEGQGAVAGDVAGGPEAVHGQV